MWRVGKKNNAQCTANIQLTHRRMDYCPTIWFKCPQNIDKVSIGIGCPLDDSEKMSKARSYTPGTTMRISLKDNSEKNIHF